MKVANFFRFIRKKLTGINDSPFKIACGMAIGVFFGLLPFAGPIISLLLAAVLRVNKLTALIGALLTNTWLTAICAIFALNTQNIYSNSHSIDFKNLMNALKNFDIAAFLKIITGDFFLPFLIVFVIIAAILSLTAFVLTLLAVNIYRNLRRAG